MAAYFFVVRVLVAVAAEPGDVFVGIYLIAVHVLVLAAVVVVAAVTVVSIVAVAKVAVVGILDIVVSADVDKIVEQVLDNL